MRMRAPLETARQGFHEGLGFAPRPSSFVWCVQDRVARMPACRIGREAPVGLPQCQRPKSRYSASASPEACCTRSGSSGALDICRSTGVTRLGGSRSRLASRWRPPSGACWRWQSLVSFITGCSRSQPGSQLRCGQPRRNRRPPGTFGRTACCKLRERVGRACSNALARRAAKPPLSEGLGGRPERTPGKRSSRRHPIETCTRGGSARAMSGRLRAWG